MPMTIFKNERSRLAFRFVRVTALRSTSDVVDQLQAQIEQLKFNAAEYERQLTAFHDSWPKRALSWPDAISSMRSPMRRARHR
jgi:hypothetical protein